MLHLACCNLDADEYSSERVGYFNPQCRLHPRNIPCSSVANHFTDEAHLIIHQCVSHGSAQRAVEIQDSVCQLLARAELNLLAPYS